MAKPSEILKKYKSSKGGNMTGSDSDDDRDGHDTKKQPAKKNALIDFIAKHKKPTK